MTQILDHLDDVGKGWRSILTNLHNNLIELVPDYDVAQVKEKFGGLRVYLKSYEPDKMDETLELLYAAEAKSTRVCEYCGGLGSPRSKRPGGWIKTVCEECFGG